MRTSIAAALLLCACERDLALPSLSGLALSPAFVSAAPREKIAFAVTGGTPPYRFAFIEGSPLSGKDASINAATGAYQAGGFGFGQDTIAVTDAAGATKQARIAVGARLATDKVLVVLAPGGDDGIKINGGKPPYTYQLSYPSGSQKDLQFKSFASGVTLEAGDQGDYVAELDVYDATGDPAARAGTVIQVTSPLQIVAPGAAQLVPYGSLDLIAIGGRPRYVFCFSDVVKFEGEVCTGPNGGVINVNSGHYDAGAKPDTIAVVDSNEKIALLTPAMLPGLAGRFETLDLHPGIPVRIVTSGGKPPYAYAFASKGNRSDGEVDAVTGIYTPGNNFGANDVIEVSDATRRARLTGIGQPVKAPIFSAGRADRCFAADLNGDGIDDVVLAATRWSGLREPALQIGLSQPGGGMRFSSTGLPPDLADVLHADLNGDGREDLLLLTRTQLQYVPATADGTPGTPLVGHVRSAGSAHSFDTLAGAWDASGARFASFFYEKNGICGATSGIARSDYVAPTAANPSGGPTAPVCVLTLAQPPTALVAGDFNGDHAVDLAWVDGANPSLLQYILSPWPAAPATVPTFTVPLGTNLTASAASMPNSELLVAADLNGDGRDDLLAAVDRTDSSSGNVESGVVRILSAAAGAPQPGPFFDPMPAPAQPMLAFAPVRSAQGLTFTSWNGIDGNLVSFGPDLLLRAAPPELPFAVNCAASPDSNGDGAADLFAINGFLQHSEIVWGEGDGTYGRRRRFGVGPIANSLDIDGDGVEDIVFTTVNSGVRVGYGGGHQISYGSETAMPFDAEAIVPGRFHGADAPADLILASSEFQLYLATGVGDGTFHIPQQLHEGANPAPPVDQVSAAEFGGGAPGPDLLVYYSNSSAPLFQAWVRNDPGDATSVYRTDLPDLAGYDACDYVVLDLDGDALSDVVAACRVTGTQDLDFLAAVSFNFGSLQFIPWQAIAGVRGATSIRWQAVGADGDRAVFTVSAAGASSSTAAFSVGMPGGGALSAIRTVLASRTSSATYALDNLDGDGFRDLLRLEGGTLTLFKGSGTGAFSLVRSTSSPEGIVFTLHDASAQADALVFLISGSELVVMDNDGTGQFR